jgi:hypothetical protein
MAQVRRPRSLSAQSPPPPRHAPPRTQKRGPAVRDSLRPEEVDAMVPAARKAGWHPVRAAAIILLRFCHGLRTAELIVLRWQHVDLHNQLPRCPSGQARTPHQTPAPQPAMTPPAGTAAPLSRFTVCVCLGAQGVLVPTVYSRHCGAHGPGGRASVRAPSPPTPSCLRLFPRVARA